MPKEPIEEVQLPPWFRQEQHAATTAGIVRKSDWALLDEEGRPVSLALRAAEARAAEEAKTQAKKEGADARK